jgi:hypothetical protein
MRLEKFIINEGRSKEIQLEDAWKIASQYSDAIKLYRKSFNYIMRGIQSNDWRQDETYRGNYLTIQPSKFERKSAYASGNYYTLLIDNLPKWKPYPKRSRSIVGSTDSNKAGTYVSSGNIYFVFPKNGSSVGVAPKGDIFNSFKDVYTLGKFTDACNNEALRDRDWKTMVQSMKEYDEQVEATIEDGGGGNRLYNSAFKDVISNFIDKYDKYDDLEKLFAHVFDPGYNGFKVVKAGTKIPIGYEVWTDGDCLMIQEDEIETFMDGL